MKTYDTTVKVEIQVHVRRRQLADDPFEAVQNGGASINLTALFMAIPSDILHRYGIRGIYSNAPASSGLVFELDDAGNRVKRHDVYDVFERDADNAEVAEGWDAIDRQEKRTWPSKENG